MRITATADPSDEAAILAPWRGAYERHLGAAPDLTHDEHGPVLRFPGDRSPAHAAAIGKVRIYGRHAPVRAHLRALGFAWDLEDYLSTTPTPLTFAARVRRLGFEPAYLPELHAIDGIYMAKPTWVARHCAGALPVTVGTRDFYRRARLRRALSRALPGGARWREHLQYHLHGPQHDMTKHALCVHLIPPAQVRQLGQRATQACHDHPHRAPPEPLSRFFENDLLAYCQQVWRDLPHPTAFAPTFTHPHNLAQLHAALEARIHTLAHGPLRWLVHTPTTPPKFTIERPPRRP